MRLLVLLTKSLILVETHSHLPLHHWLLVWLSVTWLHWLLITAHHVELIVGLLLTKCTELLLLTVHWLLLWELLLLAVWVHVETVEVLGGWICGLLVRVLSLNLGLNGLNWCEDRLLDWLLNLNWLRFCDRCFKGKA